MHVKTLFFHIFNIRRISKFLSSDTVQVLVNAFVTSRLDYCNSILFGLSNTELQKLQRVQNTAARLICNINKFDHITPTLVKLHWLPVRYRINFKILLNTCKVFNGQTVVIIKLTSTSEILLQQPRIKTLPTLGGRSFAVAALALWNNLPNAIRSATSINSFKKLLKTHLFKIAFDL